MSFSNKVILVTGASQGIGAAVAVTFAREGANVVLVGRNESKLKSVAKECYNNSSKLHIIKADITVDKEAEEMIHETIEKFGRLDVLINNAGRSVFASLLDKNIMTALDQVMALNFRAHIHVTSLAAPHLIQSKGNIINISSVTGSSVPPKPKYVSYYLSKAALDHFTRCAALEMANHGVRVNAVSPGPVNTNILATVDAQSDSSDILRTALNGMSEPEEIADLVLFLASDKAKSITGANYLIDNGCLLVNQKV